MKLKMSRTQRVLVLLTMYFGLVHSWDVALSVGDELRFYTNNTVTGTARFESQNLTSLAYDEVQNIILYVDKQTNGGGDVICRYSLSSFKYKCLTERTGRNIHGIAFDPVTDTVFFTDTNERTVNWISLKPGSEQYAREHLLIKMDEGIPRDIVVDSCKGYVYWLNTDMAKPTIERVRFSGADREVYKTITSLPFNATHKLEPNSLVLDQQTQTIHWFEPFSTKYYVMGHSEINGRNKPLKAAYYKLTDISMCMHPSNTLSVSNELFFFVDFCSDNFYIFPKTLDLSAVETFGLSSNIMTVGIVANYKITEQIQGIQNCETLNRIKISIENDATFCVHGTKVDRDSVCKCTPGYIGERCDVSVCGNFCLQGNCTVNDVGLPECRCVAGYSGVRCDVSVCENYCLQGNCTVDNEGHPGCRCVAGYSGVRCDVSVCENYCLQGNCTVDNEGHPGCRCDTGYSGVRCDVSVCENYCLQGNCTVDDVALPECRCDAGYSGVRCEINSCHGYCLNGGDCLLNEEEVPVCQCVGSFEGTRCETVKTDTLTSTRTNCSEDRNMSIADFLNCVYKPTSKMSLTIEV